MFFDRDGEVRSAFDGRIVGDDHAFSIVDPPDSGDYTGRGSRVIVHVIAGKGREFEEWGTGIEQFVNAFAREEFSPRFVLFDIGGSASEQCLGKAFAIRRHGLIHRGVVRLVVFVVEVDAGGDDFHAGIDITDSVDRPRLLGTSLKWKQ